MVPVGRHPILWHIMKYYGSFGFKDFTLATGHMGDYIKNYFLHYAELNSDFEVDLSSGKVTPLSRGFKEDWKVRLIDTGPETLTGGRLKRLEPHLKSAFFFTYGDGVSDVDLNDLLAFHKKHGKLVTMTAVRPTARFGGLEIGENGAVKTFREKLPSDEQFINGGYMVMEPGVFSYLGGDTSILEREPMERLAADGQLIAFQHQGFWQCMDTVRDRDLLDEHWASGKAPWKKWEG